MNEQEEVISPRLYDIVWNDGTTLQTSGVLGINDVFIAVVDTQEKLVFAAPLDDIKYCQVVPEGRGTQTKQ